MKKLNLKKLLENIPYVDQVIACKADERNRGKVFKLRHKYIYRYPSTFTMCVTKLKTALLANSELAAAGFQLEIIDSSTHLSSSWSVESYCQVIVEIFASDQKAATATSEELKKSELSEVKAEVVMVPDEENPRFVFAQTNTKLLIKLLESGADLRYLIMKELSSRGLDKKGNLIKKNNK